MAQKRKWPPSGATFRPIETGVNQLQLTLNSLDVLFRPPATTYIIIKHLSCSNLVLQSIKNGEIRAAVRGGHHRYKLLFSTAHNTKSDTNEKKKFNRTAGMFGQYIHALPSKNRTKINVLRRWLTPVALPSYRVHHSNSHYFIFSITFFFHIY